MKGKNDEMIGPDFSSHNAQMQAGLCRRSAALNFHLYLWTWHLYNTKKHGDVGMIVDLIWTRGNNDFGTVLRIPQ
jgi:hypothetical protein